MKFATALLGEAPALHVDTPQRFVNVAAVSTVDRPMRDVQDLLAAGPGVIDRIRDWLEDGDGEPVQLEALTLCPPVLEPRAFICVGPNYPEHVIEGGAPMPSEPVLFAKYPNALVVANDDVILHPLTKQLDYQGELAFVVGKTARRVRKSQAMGYVAGFTALNDVSARDLQLGDIQWIRGKSLDTFAPCGPLFQTVDEVADVDAFSITATVNGEVRQQALCAEMTFKIPRLLAFITEGITLEAGDIVATGTPAGTAFGMVPPAYLRVGDVVEVQGSGIGRPRNRVVAPPAA